MELNNTSSAIIYAISRGYQIHPDAFALLNSINVDVDSIMKKVVDRKDRLKEGHSILLDDVKFVIGDIVSDKVQIIGNIAAHESYQELHKNGTDVGYHVLFDPSSRINSAEDEQDYMKLFTDRYRKLLKILSARPETRRVKKIETVKREFNRTKSMREGYLEGNNLLDKSGGSSSVLVAGLLMSRRQVKDRVEIIIDDSTSCLTAIANTRGLYEDISRLALDQMVMLELNATKKIGHDFLISGVRSPDIPDHIPSKSQSESYVLLISDLHVGSKYFMEKEFAELLKWLSCDDDIAKKVKYLCIAGDIVDGIGIFPEQDKELSEIDFTEQLGHAMNLLQQIRNDIEVFIIPGNHDPGRRALPQPSLQRFIDVNLQNNFHIIGNPSLIKLDGVKILMFHGQSLDDLIATTPGLSYSSPADAMKLLLKARHLSPVFGQRTPIAPEQEDMLVIDDVPDIFHAGHVHIIGVDRYKGTLIINSGAWQSQTRYQATMGIIPTPGIAILVDLSTLQPFQKNFIYSFTH